ncbi:MAG: hypothetical protein LBP87_05515, partial [Planctomycetaceae bacterium]|nr:hypothetical protein [Planctomycetaceae bacterium]
EFWSWSPRHRVGDPNRFFTKHPASAAHTHGKRFVAAEGFTNIGMHWQESFADNLKPTFDQAVCEGCNLLVWHAFTSSPQSEGLPGQEYFAGTHFNPQHTCWNYSADFLTYINRVQFLTQQGLFAADVVQYYGDNVPNFTQGEWNNNAKSLPDYAYDVASMDAVLNMTTLDGRIFLPDGMNYKVLVLPEVSGINLFVLRKIASLVKDGATIIGLRPKRISGLTNFQNADAEVKKIADELWETDETTPNNSVTKIRPVGKGRVVSGMTAAELLRNDKLLPDVKRLSGSLPEGEYRIKWIHRTIYDNKIFGGKFAELSPIKSALTSEISPQIVLKNTNRTEIYFVSNLTGKTDKTEIAFRITKKHPEIWNAVTGIITDAKAFRQENGQTIVPIEFDPYGSIFVIFRKPISENSKGVVTDNSLQLETLQKLDGDWKVTFKFADNAIETINFPELIDWTTLADERIKYYSGSAIYRKEFSCPKFVQPKQHEQQEQQQKSQRIYLELDLVREMAVVRFNGKELCTLWSRPFRVDVTDSICEGKNILELEVVNHWANRIIGDSKLPESQRQTKTNIRRLNPQTPLLESGLIGTVQLKTLKK